MKTLVTYIVVVGSVLVLMGCQQNVKPKVSPSGGLQSIYFDFDRSNIRADAMAPMEGNAGYLKQNSNDNITVEGNCDNRGTNEYNIALGQRRSDSAKNYLVNLGINSTRMKTVTYGEEKPSCNENNEVCWQKNRRADLMKN